MRVPERAMRRLYCLECGDGAHLPLPAESFVKTHKVRHGFTETDVPQMFMVVERQVGDTITSLDNTLAQMYRKDWLVWSDDHGAWAADHLLDEDEKLPEVVK